MRRHYRIGFINDFTASRGFVSYQSWGEPTQAESWEGFKCSNEHKGFQTAKDSIGVFLNFKMVLETKDAKEAQNKLNYLLEQSPVKMDFLKEYLALK